MHNDRGRLRLVLATERSPLGEGLAVLLADVPDVVMAGVARGPAEMVGLVDRAEPDALVVTVRTGVVTTMTTLLAVRRLRARFPSMGIVIISDRVDSFSLELLLHDASRIAYLLADETPRVELVVGALRTVCAGGSVLGPSVRDDLERLRRGDDIGHLTGMESDVLEQIAEGLSNQEVADQLHLPVWAVDVSVSAIFAKLGLVDQRFEDRRTAAVLIYLRSRVVQPSRAPGDEDGPRPSHARNDRVEPPVEVALVDTDGIIVSVNAAWEDFGRANGGDPARTGVGESYLDVCLGTSDPDAEAVGQALRHALLGDLPAPMKVAIPCHGPEVRRHFDVLISSRIDDRGRCVGATVTLSPTR